MVDGIQPGRIEPSTTFSFTPLGESTEPPAAGPPPAAKPTASSTTARRPTSSQHRRQRLHRYLGWVVPGHIGNGGGSSSASAPDTTPSTAGRSGPLPRAW
ncbi:MAG: hypothetical protein OEY41_04780 [Acidimicrobiia bacterium]|nr:hypothetical protein [Acidimicrobiia bacterium]MDH4364749.1 hypothetical protein [Acidimicrobiia bacterium]MDH5289296.1 hypothetical protein [Acidimicrobiia bacterium]